MNYVRFQDYCIPLSLLSDYFNYKQFKTTQTNIINIYNDLEYYVFFCQSMHITIYCELVANLCVLSQYSLERFSPCNIFYASQSTIVSEIGVNGFKSRITPFLFYAKGKNTLDDLDKIIDQRYRYGSKRDDFYEDDYLTNEISMVMIGHSIDGDLKTIEPLRLQEFNFCGDKNLPDPIQFGEDLVSSCRLKLNDLIERGEQRPWIMNLYLNYTENKVNLMKAVPILIRNAFSHNMNPYDRERWQLVRKFYLVDVFTAQNRSYRQQRYENAANFDEKYIMIRYARRIEFRFELNENHRYYGNKISVPLLIIEYGEIDLYAYRHSSFYDIDFEFTVTFIKPFGMGTFFHVRNFKFKFFVQSIQQFFFRFS